MFRGVPSVMDVEASGFGGASYPIEIGVVLEDGSRYCSLIKPAEEWTFWTAEAEGVHHISREVLHQHGKPLRVVAEELNAFLSGKTVYSDGWVVDSPWVHHLFDTAHVSQAFRLSPLEMILTEPQMEIWHETKEALLQHCEHKRHRASFDASIIQQTFVKTAQLIQGAAE
ncbi:MAG: hypothetical protein L3J38_00120 [Thiomicrorhabdus sp.]|nr:hypothetical protein [Thiomicrorhabdus sp.]MCF6299306.1 hypothetical protein [Thiomicrorhabdus sp.]